jgi:hypothetical protein
VEVSELGFFEAAEPWLLEGENLLLAHGAAGPQRLAPGQALVYLKDG